MPRTLLIENQAFYDAFYHIVSKNNLYQSIKYLDIVNGLEAHSELEKGILFNYLFIHYHSAYMLENDCLSATQIAQIDLALERFKPLMRLYEVSMHIEVKGPAGSVPASFPFPKLSHASWQYLFRHHPKKIQYIHEENGAVNLSGEARQYWDSCATPQQVLAFWIDLLNDPRGLSFPSFTAVNTVQQEFVPEHRNPGKAGLRKMFELCCLNLSYMRNSLLEEDYTLTDTAQKIWAALCGEPEIYKELRVAFIYTLCYGAQHSVVMAQLAQEPHKLRTHIEYARGPLPYPMGGIVFSDDRDFADRLLAGLAAEISVGSPLENDDKEVLFKRFAHLFSQEVVLGLARGYAAQDWLVFRKFKNLAAAMPNFENSKYQQLEQENVQNHKASWPESFKKLENLIARIEDSQKPSQSRIGGAITSIAGLASRVPNPVPTVTTFINTQVGENLNISWVTTIKQLQAFKSEHGLELKSAAGIMRLFADEYKKENIASSHVTLDVLPVSLAERITMIITPVVVQAQSSSEAAVDQPRTETLNFT